VVDAAKRRRAQRRGNATDAAHTLSRCHGFRPPDVVMPSGEVLNENL
jgi:hypothetical protein